MIPIPNAYLDCCAYIYRTRADAEVGARSGGSGFFVGVPLEQNKERFQIYAVTAKHVLDGIDTPTLRVNLTEGGLDYFETERGDWKDHPDGDDLSVCPIEIEGPKHSIGFSSVHDFVDYRRRSLIRPGDDVFMIGRFIGHEGTQQNTPSVRFGNISMLATETMKNKYGHDQQTFLVEHRSLPGYSGSPVFVFLDPNHPRPPIWLTPLNRMGKINLDTTGPWLLGVDWLHIQNYEEVLDNISPPKIAAPLRYVKSHTGMAGVIPAWRLADMLNKEEFCTQREKYDETIIEQGKNTSYPSCDSADTPESATLNNARRSPRH